MRENICFHGDLGDPERKPRLCSTRWRPVPAVTRRYKRGGDGPAEQWSLPRLLRLPSVAAAFRRLQAKRGDLPYPHPRVGHF